MLCGLYLRHSKTERILCWTEARSIYVCERERVCVCVHACVHKCGLLKHWKNMPTLYVNVFFLNFFFIFLKHFPIIACKINVHLLLPEGRLAQNVHVIAYYNKRNSILKPLFVLCDSWSWLWFRIVNITDLCVFVWSTANGNWINSGYFQKTENCCTEL